MNPQRGEVTITLQGQEFVLRPSYEALVGIEQMTGDTVVSVARRVTSASYGIADAVAIVTAGLKAAGAPATPKKVGEMIFATGLLDISGPLTAFMTNALTGGEQPGEAVAAEPTESRTDASPPSPTPQ
jgi:hypothetical protein